MRAGNISVAFRRRRRACGWLVITACCALGCIAPSSLPKTPAAGGPAWQELTTDLQRDLVRRPLAPAADDAVDPFAIGHQGPVGVGVVLERRVERPANTRAIGIAPAILSALRSFGGDVISYKDAGMPRKLAYMNWKEFGPRLGFAYRGFDGAKGREMRAFGEQLVREAILIETGKLASAKHPAIVQVRAGGPLVTDGPFAESKEYLAGYYLIDCESYERALDLAAKIPDARYNAIEVRAVLDMSGQEM